MNKVFILGKYDINENPFFDGIIKRSQFDYEYISLNYSVPENSIILLQWPEKIFDWEYPTDENLVLLEERLKKWSVKSKIIYQVHNLRRHYGMTKNFEKLYKLVYNYSQVFVHFGQYSEDLFGKKYASKRHIFIPHPLYETPFIFPDKTEARKRLKLNQNDLVIAVPGRVRHDWERKFILKTFEKFPAKKNRKVLLVPYMKYRESNLEFLGRYKLKRFFDLKKWHEKKINKKNDDRYKFDYSFQAAEELSYIMSASDIILIPRKNILNSGNLFLGLSYSKVILGPKSGNIEEFLEKFDMPSFDPDNRYDINKSLQLAHEKVINEFKPDAKILAELAPKVIAKKWDNLFHEILNDNNVID